MAGVAEVVVVPEMVVEGVGPVAVGVMAVTVRGVSDGGGEEWLMGREERVGWKRVQVKRDVNSNPSSDEFCSSSPQWKHVSQSSISHFRRLGSFG